jgi:CIC family chloride channel protein
VVLASVTASVIGRAAFGDQPFLQLPAFVMAHLYDFALFAVLGLVAGLVGVVFTRVLYLVEDICDRVWRGPEWLRPAVGGVLLGTLLLVMPKLYGVGYPVLSAGVAGAYSIGLALALAAGKILATSLTIGIGGSGGVFAPSLFMGAMLGSAFGQLVGAAAPGVAGSAGAYGLIGMGAVFAGAARAPITAVVIMFELTGEYGIILPLMVAISLATGISHVLSKDTIYTLKLARRGVELSRPADSGVRAQRVLVGQVMSAVPASLVDDTPLTKAASALANTRFAVLPVVDASGAYRGTVTSGAVLAALADGNHDRTTVAEFCELPPTVTADVTVEAAIDALDRCNGTAVPVLDPADRSLVGWLTTQAALAAIRPGMPSSGSRQGAAS